MYVTGTGGPERARAQSGPVLVEVPVVDVPGLDDSFGAGGAGGDRQIVLGVPASEVADLYSVLAAFDSPTVSVAVHP